MKLFLYSYNRLNPYSQLYCMYGMLVYTNSIRHHYMIHSLRSLPRIGYTQSHSSMRNIWTSSRNSRTCSERWSAPKPPFCSDSCHRKRSGILKNSRCNSFHSRTALRQPQPDRHSRYIVRRSCPRILNADKNSWKRYIDIPACRRRIDIFRHRKRRYRSLWPNRQPARGRIRRKRTFRRSFRRRRPVRPDRR